MNISSYQTANIASLQSAVNIATLKMTMNQDAKSVGAVIKAMERSVSPGKGGSIDLKV